MKPKEFRGLFDKYIQPHWHYQDGAADIVWGCRKKQIETMSILHFEAVIQDLVATRKGGSGSASPPMAFCVDEAFMRWERKNPVKRESDKFTGNILPPECAKACMDAARVIVGHRPPLEKIQAIQNMLDASDGEGSPFTPELRSEYEKLMRKYARQDAQREREQVTRQNEPEQGLPESVIPEPQQTAPTGIAAIMAEARRRKALADEFEREIEATPAL